MATELRVVAHGSDALPTWERVLAVVAHPDDEPFGIGAVLDAFACTGSAVSVLCLTHGEASTLHGVSGTWPACAPRRRLTEDWTPGCATGGRAAIVHLAAPCLGCAVAAT